MAFHEKGKFGEGAHKYAGQLALERMTGELDERMSFSTKDTALGHEQEPIARELYEAENFVEVKPGGFFCNEFTGSSPDGLVGEDGGVEIKCVKQNTHWARLKEGGIDPKYKWQIQKQLRDTGRKWWDFVQYCSAFPVGAQLHIVRVEPDPEMQAALAEREVEFEKLIEEKITLLRQMRGEDVLTEQLEASLKIVS